VKVRRGQGRTGGKGRDQLVEEREIKFTEARNKKLKPNKQEGTTIEMNN